MLRLGLLIASVFIILAKLSGQCVDDDNVYEFEFDGRKYEIVQEKKTWDDAVTCAKERGGSLVEINTLAEQTAVYAAITEGAQIPDDYVSVMNGGGIAYIWIGATDANEEGVWLWDGNSDNEGSTFWTGEGENGVGGGKAIDNAFVFWGGTSENAPKEPDNYGSGQDHAAIGLAPWPSNIGGLGIAGEWNDIIGSSNIYFVVEYKFASAVIDKRKKFLIYPNPASDFITIEADKDANVQLISLIGQCFKLEVNKPNNVSEIPDGIYFVSIFEKGKFYTEKLVIQ